MLKLRSNKQIRLFLIVLTVIFFVVSNLVAQEKNMDQFLPPGKGIELVVKNCTACHSADIILQNNMSRKGWDEQILLMQKEQGMGRLNKDDRKVILDYLSKFQGIDSNKPLSKTIRKKIKPMYEFYYRPNPL